VKFSICPSLKGDIISEEVLNNKLQQQKVLKFNKLLKERENWRIIKNFTKFSMELRRCDEYGHGVPMFTMSCVLKNIKPYSAFSLFSEQIKGKPFINKKNKSINFTTIPN